jgi:phenylacetate-CoA ligase
MNVRKALYFGQARLRGRAYPVFFRKYLQEDRQGIAPDTSRKLLIQLLAHAKQNVPYYAKIMQDLGDSFHQDPYAYLQRLPILTKDVIRDHFDKLKSLDLVDRKWQHNTSGGSTGVPVRFVQDSEYRDRSLAISLCFAKWNGKDVGESQVKLWGSERDILHGTVGWYARLFNYLNNNTLLNSFRLTPDGMRRYIRVINVQRPNLIVAYAQSIYELARFAEREHLQVVPQKAIQVSAGTLHDFMREKIEKVFQCPVYNFYGSREVGAIAGERPNTTGLWVAPWGNYLEIVDDAGRILPRGEGELIVTSLTNYAMPLIRYQIGDRGTLADQANGVQILKQLLGRTVDRFRNSRGELIDGEYFTHLIYFKDWVRQFQVIQKHERLIVCRIVRSGQTYQQEDLDDIVIKTKVVMGNECAVNFEFVDDIQAGESGKYRFTISEVVA